MAIIAMPLIVPDRVLETTTTVGTGSLALAGAVTGYNSFSSGVGANNTCFYALDSQSSSEWEVGLGTLDSLGTTLARTSILSSSNGNAVVNLSAGTKRVYVTYPGNFVIPSTGYIGANNNSPPNYTPGGRLTLTSNEPLLDGTRTTLYYTPYTSDLVYLTTSTGYWRPYNFSEISFSLSGPTTGSVNDIFLYDNAGTLTLERSTAFTGGTSRVDAISLRNGVYVKSSDPTRLWLGTIRWTGSGTVAESATTGRFVWNAYNRVLKTLEWNYGLSGTVATSTVLGPVSGTASRIQFVCGLSSAEAVHLFLSANCIGTTNGGAGVTVNLGFGVNTTTAFTAQKRIFQQVVNSTTRFGGSFSYNFVPSLGYSYVSFNRVCVTAGAAPTFLGSSGSSGDGGPTMKGLFWC